MRTTMFGMACVLAVGCGGKDDDGGVAGDCAGDHVGTYEGDDEGGVTATFDAEGLLTVTFGTSFGDVNSVATVGDDGAVDGCSEGVCIEGDYDFDACSASGTWTNAALGLDGTWSIGAI